ncbi:Trm112 family protein [Aestuariibacter sp. GS-14]|uniref:Trm112 family protein n=1 Tax=Alteromonadaceae TaxID=72275 RepID=UPI00112C911F|nr:Trm112 family protein [Aestuariibacter sp. GS-14]TPV61050.1 Trm112 family protein [Aestuariibacter sp. GS-14]
MAFDRKLLDVIACPVCKGKLLFAQHQNADALICRFDRLVYPLHDGIPVLLEEQASSISLEQLEALKKG